MAPPDSDAMAGIPHPEGTLTHQIAVKHPETGEEHTIHVPADHDGSKIKVEFPDGTVAYTEGWDPVDRADMRASVPCGACGQPQVLTGRTEFVCPACGTRNSLEVRTSGDSGDGSSSEG